MDTNPTAETPDIETQTPQPVAPESSGPTALMVGVLLGFIAIAGALYGLRHELISMMAQDAAANQEALAKLATRVSTLETQTAAIAAQPRPDLAVIDGMHTDLGAAQQNLATLTQRVDALEKKPAPVAAAPKAPAPRSAGEAPLITFIKSGAPYQTELAAFVKDNPDIAVPNLQHFATTGLPSDEMLRQQFHQALTQAMGPTATVPAADDKGIVARINAHLSGLITIKKQSTLPPELTALRDMADSAAIPVLIERVNALSPTNKPTFQNWLDAVHTRDAANSELVTLGQGA